MLIFILAFFLRLYHLGYHDLWYDEAMSVKYARFPWDNWNAPLYWILLHFWTKISGISEFSLRFPSLIFSFLSVILAYILGKTLFNKKVATWAGILMALSPFQLWYAQEARAQSMMLFLGLLSNLFLLKSLQTKKTIFRIWFVIISLIGIYTDYFYILLIIAQCLYLVFSERTKLKPRHIIPFIIIALGFLPYMSRFLDKFSFVQAGFWLPKPNLRSLSITFENFLFGYNVYPFFYFLADILIAGMFIFAALRMKDKEYRKPIVFCLFLLLPIVLAFIFSRIFFSIYLDRSLIIFSPYFYLILAFFVNSLNGRKFKLFFSGILCFLLIWAVRAFYLDQMCLGHKNLKHHLGTYIKKPFKPIVQFIQANLRQGDIVGVTSASPPLLPSLSFYSRDKIAFYYFFSPGMIDTNWKRPISEDEYRLPVHKIDALDFKRLWIISCDVGLRSGGLDENSKKVKDWLEKRLKLEFAREFDGLWLFRYRR